MLLTILKRLTGGAARRDKPQRNVEAAERAGRLMASGDRRNAIKAFREYLETDPANVVALNDLAACLADAGDQQEAARLFELAHSLDDNFMPATVNCAKLQTERGQSRQALPYLRRAKICTPRPGHVDAVYAGVLMRQGDVEGARHYQLQAWLGAFDNLRMANCHLFWLSYGDVDEQALAAEHRFWANTVMAAPQGTLPVPDDAPLALETAGRKLRIGYWSPDFRSHSVRYFFRPLVENHDRERFEVFLYNDFPRADEQTELIRSQADHFHEVFETSDADLADLIRSHQLDLLVELSGHTSHNRMSMLQNRLARRQMQAIGYPPTSGLTTVDAKLLDRHAVTDDWHRYYAEQPLVLPGSFWCFDPLEPTPPLPDPPVIANGFVTFGCVGNISKITDRLLAAWRRILTAVPDSRLVIRSISFEDELPEEAARLRFERAGLPLDRVQLLKPAGGAAFFSSYNEIDVILDTFPFNGGTTTCFAAYMGVCVVSMAGASLPSRMGLSILTNLGAADLVVQDMDAYVERATRSRVTRAPSQPSSRRPARGSGTRRSAMEPCLRASSRAPASSCWPARSWMTTEPGTSSRSLRGRSCAGPTARCA
jgi:protein O-GlcNAc transferase